MTPFTVAFRLPFRGGLGPACLLAESRSWRSPGRICHAPSESHQGFQASHVSVGSPAELGHGLVFFPVPVTAPVRAREGVTPPVVARPLRRVLGSEHPEISPVWQRESFRVPLLVQGVLGMARCPLGLWADPGTLWTDRHDRSSRPFAPQRARRERGHSFRSAHAPVPTHPRGREEVSRERFLPCLQVDSSRRQPALIAWKEHASVKARSLSRQSCELFYSSKNPCQGVFPPNKVYRVWINQMKSCHWIEAAF